MLHNNGFKELAVEFLAHAIPLGGSTYVLLRYIKYSVNKVV